MTTPNGQFMTQRKLCLSMSDFRLESWNPMWSVSSILTGLLSFMDSFDLPVDYFGQLPQDLRLDLKDAAFDLSNGPVIDECGQELGETLLNISRAWEQADTSTSTTLVGKLPLLLSSLKGNSKSAFGKRLVSAGRRFQSMGQYGQGELQSGKHDREPIEVKPDKSMEWEYLKRDHRVYAFLARGLTSFVRKDCVSEAIFASSTDNYPEESIQNTLEPSDRVEQRASYWSSEGESDPTVPEILDYKLIAKLCVITEIHVQPFQAYFQLGFPIYSAKAVRFRMGRPRSSMEIGSDFRDEFEAGRESPDYAFEWTYTSPEFPMAQVNCLQKFKLPEPVLCIGGILQVELLGRVQRQELDGLFYIWSSQHEAA